MSKAAKKQVHVPMKRPRNPRPDGLFAIKDAHVKKNGDSLVGITCLFCPVDVPKSKHGRIICKKKGCFRLLRNAYRRDYDGFGPAKAVADLLGPAPKKSKAKKPAAPKAAKKSKPKVVKVDDLLGPAPKAAKKSKAKKSKPVDVDDLLGPAPKAKKSKKS